MCTDRTCDVYRSCMRCVQTVTCDVYRSYVRCVQIVHAMCTDRNLRCVQIATCDVYRSCVQCVQTVTCDMYRSQPVMCTDRACNVYRPEAKVCGIAFSMFAQGELMFHPLHSRMMQVQHFRQHTRGTRPIKAYSQGIYLFTPFL